MHAASHIHFYIHVCVCVCVCVRVCLYVIFLNMLPLIFFSLNVENVGECYKTLKDRICVDQSKNSTLQKLLLSLLLLLILRWISQKLIKVKFQPS